MSRTKSSIFALGFFTLLLTISLAASAPAFAKDAANGNANLKVSPDSLSFGNVPIGSTSPEQTVLATNGSKKVTIDIASILTSPPFIKSSDTCDGSLAPSGTCSVGVECMPTTSGAVTGTLTFTYSAGKHKPKTATVSLTCTGTGGTPTPTATATATPTASATATPTASSTATATQSSTATATRPQHRLRRRPHHQHRPQLDADRVVNVDRNCDVDVRTCDCNPNVVVILDSLGDRNWHADRVVYVDRNRDIDEDCDCNPNVVIILARPQLARRPRRQPRPQLRHRRGLPRRLRPQLDSTCDRDVDVDRNCDVDEDCHGDCDLNLDSHGDRDANLDRNCDVDEDCHRDCYGDSNLNFNLNRDRNWRPRRRPRHLDRRRVTFWSRAATSAGCSAALSRCQRQPTRRPRPRSMRP